MYLDVAVYANELKIIAEPNATDNPQDLITLGIVCHF